MWWLIIDADRARSFSTIMRTAGAVMTMLELVDWTKTARVKAQIKQIEKVCGVEPDPCTQTTRRIVSLMVGKTIPQVCSKGRHEDLNRILTSRTKVLLVLELLGGMRVGEATSSGDLHGVEANNVCFLQPAGLSRLGIRRQAGVDRRSCRGGLEDRFWPSHSLCRSDGRTVRY